MLYLFRCICTVLLMAGHTRSHFKIKKNTWLAVAKTIYQEKNAVEGNSDL